MTDPYKECWLGDAAGEFYRRVSDQADIYEEAFGRRPNVLLLGQGTWAIWERHKHANPSLRVADMYVLQLPYSHLWDSMAISVTYIPEKSSG